MHKIFNKNLLFSFLISIFLFFNLYLRFINSNLGFLDFGSEIFNTKKIFDYNFDFFIKGHIKIIQLVFFPIFYINNYEIIGVIFIFTKVILIFFVLLFFLSKKLNFFYILFCPLLWIIGMFDFNYDIILIPTYILVFELSKKNLKYFYFSLLFGLVKEQFFIISFLIGFFLLLKKQFKIGFYLIFINFFFAILFFFILFKGNFYQTFQYLNPNDFSLVNFYESLPFFFILIVYLFIISHKFNIHIFIFYCLIIIYFFISFFHKINLISHYSIPYLAPLFYLLAENSRMKNFFHEKKYNIMLNILLFFFNFSLSISPLSFWFWNDNYKYYNYKSMMSYSEKNNFEKYISTIDFNNKNLILQNNFFHFSFLGANSIDIFPNTSTKENTLIVISLLREKFFYDKRCNIDDHICHSYYNIEYLIKNNYKNFNISYSSSDIYVLINY
jgi:hypothetical protein